MQKLAILQLALLLVTQLLIAQSGQLDPSFADNGLFIADLHGQHDVPKAVALQEDGKIVVILSEDYPDAAGFEIAILRLNTDGTIDSTFADQGEYRYFNPTASDLAYHIQVLEDGKILGAGSHGTTNANPDLLLIKLNADGTPDASFGTDGVAIQPIGTGQDYIFSFTINEAGQIIAGGTSHFSGSSYRKHLVCRFNTNGTLDSTFAENGVFTWGNDETYNDIYDVEIAEDGGILACGKSVPAGTDRMSLYKILEDGSSLDSTFATNGALLAPFQGTAAGMIVHSNGNILLTGGITTLTGSDIVVLAYDSEGAPVTDFGQDGAFYFNIEQFDRSTSIIEQVDGKVMIAGSTGGSIFDGGEPGKLLSVRIDATGIIDPSWGGEGHVRTVIPETLGAIANDLVIQPDAKVILIGQHAALGGNDMVVARYGNFIDQDGDGYGVDTDCDDLVFAINPGVEETPYNGLDDDCDPSTPDDDLDGDGFLFVDDCDDENPEINPDAIEIPGNDVDENCDNIVVGTNEPVLAQQFSIYPNPTSNVVYIDFSIDAPSIELVELHDYTGKKIGGLTTQAYNNKVAVNLSTLPPGLFLLTIHTIDGLVVKRILKH
jgi:uncharacterized delta-60 repeat protein